MDNKCYYKDLLLDFIEGEGDGNASRNAQQHHQKHRDSQQTLEDHFPGSAEDDVVEEDGVAVTEQGDGYWEVSDAGADVDTADRDVKIGSQITHPSCPPEVEQGQDITGDCHCGADG